MQNILRNFLEEIEFPKEDAKEALFYLDKIQRCAEAAGIYKRHFLNYRDRAMWNFEEYDRDLNIISELVGLERERINLPLHAILLSQSEKLFAARGCSHEIWRNTVMDIRWKCPECKKLKGFTGLIGTQWYGGFLHATRYALGRLQFEILPSPIAYKSENFDVKIGTPTINVHIPADYRNPLDKKNRDESYAAARDFFKDKLDKIIFHCSSWLLLPAHKFILPEGSNIRAFMEEYEIAESSESTANLWRIFNTYEIYENPALYPEETSLQRAYKKFMFEGGKPGGARGFLKQ